MAVPRAPFVLILLLSWLHANAQKLTFAAAEPYTEQQLERAMGVRDGEQLNDAAVRAASAQLSETGLFDLVAATAVNDGSEIRYTLKTVPENRLLTPSFANFVWFTPEEIDRELRARVPLYRGLVPASGTLADGVQAVLEQMLSERGVTATVRHTVIEPTTAHPLRVMSFRIYQPEVLLTIPRLSGIEELQQGQQSAVTDALARLAGRPYVEGASGVTLQESLLGPVRDLGYVAARVENLQRTVRPSAKGYEVTVTGRLVPGAIYTLGELMWAPTPAYSVADFQYDLEQHPKETLRPGAVASQRALVYTELQVANVYHLLGYMDAYLGVIEERDDGAHTVTYKLRVVPGEQYRVRQIRLNGAPSAVVLDYNTSWTMRQGDLYNPLYLGNWVKMHTERHQFDGYSIRYFAATDVDAHRVDLTVTFVSKTQPQGGSTP